MVWQNEDFTIEQGLDFMLAHFIGPVWPRNVSTAATRNAQKLVEDRDRAILYFQGALRVDCRVAIYSKCASMSDLGLNTPGSKPRPTHLFIDLDAASFGDDRDKLDSALKQTLKNLKQLLGATPTVLWSGGGYHVHQPLDPNVMPIYEDLPEFKRYKDPSVQFMRYAEQMLTGGKADPNHRISFSSCMARLPASRNSKYEGDTAGVKIVQAWNGIRARPSTQFLLTDFLIWLVQADFDARERMRKQAQRFPISSRIREDTQGIAWIESLLQTPIPDWRKTTVALILAPYLLTIKRISYEQAYYTIMRWVTRCAELSSLRPNESRFINRVHMSLERALSRQSRPLKWSTLVSDYSQIYEMINNR